MFRNGLETSLGLVNVVIWLAFFCVVFVVVQVFITGINDSSLLTRASH